MVKDIVLVLIGMLFGGTCVLVFACLSLSGRLSDQEWQEEMEKLYGKSGIRK